MLEYLVQTLVKYMHATQFLLPVTCSSATAASCNSAPKVNTFPRLACFPPFCLEFKDKKFTGERPNCVKSGTKSEPDFEPVFGAL